MKHDLGLHHLAHRIHGAEEAMVAEERKKHLIFLDYTALTVGLLGPLFAIPQLYIIVANQSSAGVSLWTWVLGLVSATVWTFYGLAHRERAIIIPNIIWILVEVPLVLAIIFYS